FKAVVDIDLLGSFNACRAAFDQLAETRGSVTFISAGQAFIPYPAQVHVGAAKAGVDQLMRNLALEWGRYGIRCNSIAPGPIEGTEGMRRLGPDDPSLHDRLKAAIPLGRYGTVDEIGAAAVFLASPLAAYVTGTLLVVDGGQNLAGSAPFAALLASAMGQER
ncbi:MAG TPA: SDR family oxidoreductase, partial [Candidatus Sulfomarinibacteraceae bacterium]|nr:SDR family oxidoreductase [Candidatus Sulfomarinibacteraceae bacterium]